MFHTDARPDAVRSSLALRWEFFGLNPSCREIAGKNIGKKFKFALGSEKYGKPVSGWALRIECVFSGVHWAITASRYVNIWTIWRERP
jgi:hypothetical protein